MTRRTLFRRAQDAPRGRRSSLVRSMLALLTATISVIGVAQAGTSTVNIFGSVTPTNASRHRHPTRSSSAPSSR